MANVQGGGQQQQLYGIEEVIDYIKKTAPLYDDRKLVDEFAERDILSVSELLLEVAKKVLEFAINGITNPYGDRFTDREDGVKLYKAIKKGLLQKIGHLHQLLSNDIPDVGTGSQTPTVTRPGQTLDQPSTLTCPSCNESIEASIEVIVRDGKFPSMEVSVNAKWQEDEPGITCPFCAHRFKTQLRIGASSVGNSLSVRVRLENESPTENQKLVTKIETFIQYAWITLDKEVKPQGKLDNDEFALVNKCLQASYLMIMTLDDESFRSASWYQEDEQSFSVMDRVESYVKHKLATIDNPARPLTPL